MSKGVIGYPKYQCKDVVKFELVENTGKWQVYQGTVEIVDKYGTFEQSEEPSYDIMVENFHEHGKCLVKHIRESAIVCKLN